MMITGFLVSFATGLALGFAPSTSSSGATSPDGDRNFVSIGAWEIKASFTPQLDIARDYHASGIDLDVNRGPRDFYFDAVLVQELGATADGLSCSTAHALMLSIVAETGLGAIELNADLSRSAEDGWSVMSGTVKLVDVQVPQHDTFIAPAKDTLRAVDLTCMSESMANIEVTLDGTLPSTVANGSADALALTLYSTAEAPLIDAASYSP